MNIDNQYKFHKIWNLSIRKNAKYKFSNIIPIEWQLILMSDGSFTQNLTSLTGKIIKLYISSSFTCHIFNQIYYVREVWLQSSSYKKLTFAKSLWPGYEYNTSKRDISVYQLKPLGQSLIEYKVDIYKDIHEIYYGYCTYLEEQFEVYEAIWGRKCTIYHKNKPLATIQEIFSPKIIELLQSF